MLPAYVIGRVLAGTVGKDHTLIRRLRALSFGLLTPFYFIRAGSLSVPALIAAPAAFLYLLLAKMATRVIGVYPMARPARRRPIPPRACPPDPSKQDAVRPLAVRVDRQAGHDACAVQRAGGALR